MEENQQVYAKVEKIMGRSGPGGGIMIVQVRLENGRCLVRGVIGSLRRGDIVVLMESEREQKMGRARG